MRVQLSRGRLRLRFLAELLLLLFPLLLGLVVGLLGAWPFVPAAIALGVLLTLPRRYPARGLDADQGGGACDDSSRTAWRKVGKAPIP